jgi:dihydroorotate dehydrogenase (NAD+) catalytic subunit
MGGIGTAQDIRDYRKAAGDRVVFGIGTRLKRMTEDELAEYFPTLVSDLENGTDNAEGLLKKVDMSYRKVRVEEVVNPDCDLKVYRTDISIDVKAGQFVFAWIPGIGEKPFSIMDDNPLTLGVLEKGYFTRHFNSLKVGDEFYVRGPHGKGVEENISNGKGVVLVGGGCGIAGLYLLAKQLSGGFDIVSLLGAKDKKHLPYLGKFHMFGDVRVATEDGSIGTQGTVVDLFSEAIREDLVRKGDYFFNCGPRAMVEVVLPLELEVSAADRIYSSVDYMTRCGVGICGSCADSRGLRTCVEGPFMKCI